MQDDRSDFTQSHRRLEHTGERRPPAGGRLALLGGFGLGQALRLFRALKVAETYRRDADEYARVTEQAKLVSLSLFITLKPRVE